MELNKDTDKLIADIVNYVYNYKVSGEEVYSAAQYCILDTIGCGFLALEIPECAKLLGPIVPGTIVPNGVHVPGTTHVLDPIQAAFNIGTLNQWLNLNDTFNAKEICHPSDNLAAIISVAEYVSRENVSHGKPPLTLHDVTTALIKAYEIHGVLALQDTFETVHLDQVALVKVASTAVAAFLLGASPQETANALSNVFVDGHPLSVFRHEPNEGTRQYWAAGDAALRAVQLAFMAVKGEMGYPTAITAKDWGFLSVYFKNDPNKTLGLSRPLGSYVIENVKFKTQVPTDLKSQVSDESVVGLKEATHDLEKKFSTILSHHFPKKRVEDLTQKLTKDYKTFSELSVITFVDLFIN